MLFIRKHLAAGQKGLSVAFDLATIADTIRITRGFQEISVKRVWL